MRSARLLPVLLLAAAAAAPAVSSAASVPLCFGKAPTITGTAGKDVLVGTPADDVIAGRGGDDRVSGRAGDDLICGGAGDDTLLGDIGADFLEGGRDADALRGGGGRDLLRGGLGPDRLEGGRGRDVARGGPGEDACSAEAAIGCEEAVAGLPVALEAICREAWGALPMAFAPPTHTVARLTVHHSAAFLASNAEAPARLRAHQEFHLESGWADLAYHFAVDAHGHVYYGRPVAYRSDTFTGYDTTGHLQVVLEGNFNEQPVPEAQLTALVDLLAWAAAQYDIGLDTISGHRDHAATACPGDSLYARLGGVRALAEARLEAGGVQLVTVCGAEGEALVAAITAGTDPPRDAPRPGA